MKRDIALLFTTRIVRLFAYGFLSVVLVLYLTEAGLSEAQVRRALLEARADQPEIASRITADAGTAVRPETSPVVAAVKKLITKE